MTADLTALRRADGERVVALEMRKEVQRGVRPTVLRAAAAHRRRPAAVSSCTAASPPCRRLAAASPPSQRCRRHAAAAGVAAAAGAVTKHGRWPLHLRCHLLHAVRRCLSTSPCCCRCCTVGHRQPLLRPQTSARPTAVSSPSARGPAALPLAGDPTCRSTAAVAPQPTPCSGCCRRRRCFSGRRPDGKRPTFRCSAV
jgi:hypothetical protein